MKRKFYFLLLAMAALIAWLLVATLKGTPPELFEFRLTRLTAAFFVGGALALAGSLTQSIFRNALATPDTLGVSGGAALGAVVAILYGAGHLEWSLPFGAFAGAMLTFLLVSVIGKFGKDGALELLLAGVIAGTSISGILLYLVSQANVEELAGFSWWMLGDLSCVDPDGVIAVAAVAFATLVVARIFANDLNAMVFGDEGAALLGVAVPRVRFWLLAASTLLVALSVSICGIIGFIGLVVPHIMRKISGSNMRYLPSLSFVCGGLFLMGCDRLGRWLEPVRQLPPGVLTSILGGVVFLAVLYRKGGRSI